MTQNSAPTNVKPFFSRKPVVISLLTLGSLVLVAHIAGAVWLGMTLSDWMSGAAIGLILIIFALAHLLIPSHTRNRVVNMNKQVLYWLIAVIAGLVAGFIAVLVVSYIGWFAAILGAIGAVSVGRYLEGNSKTKAVRLLLFGFVGGLTFLSFVSPHAFASNIGIAFFCGVGAVLVGLLTHLTVGPPKPRN